MGGGGTEPDQELAVHRAGETSKMMDDLSFPLVTNPSDGNVRRSSFNKLRRDRKEAHPF
jgi:hypothetical protein